MLRITKIFLLGLFLSLSLSVQGQVQDEQPSFQQLQQLVDYYMHWMSAGRQPVEKAPIAKEQFPFFIDYCRSINNLHLLRFIAGKENSEEVRLWALRAFSDLRVRLANSENATLDESSGSARRANVHSAIEDIKLAAESLQLPGANIQVTNQPTKEQIVQWATSGLRGDRAALTALAAPASRPVEVTDETAAEKIAKLEQLRALLGIIEVVGILGSEDPATEPKPAWLQQIQIDGELDPIREELAYRLVVEITSAPAAEFAWDILDWAIGNEYLYISEATVAFEKLSHESMGFNQRLRAELLRGVLNSITDLLYPGLSMCEGKLVDCFENEGEGYQHLTREIDSGAVPFGRSLASTSALANAYHLYAENSDALAESMAMANIRNRAIWASDIPSAMSLKIDALGYLMGSARYSQWLTSLTPSLPSAQKDEGGDGQSIATETASSEVLSLAEYLARIAKPRDGTLSVLGAYTVESEATEASTGLWARAASALKSTLGNEGQDGVRRPQRPMVFTHDGAERYFREVVFPEARLKGLSVSAR